jgi:hypothetical protein
MHRILRTVLAAALVAGSASIVTAGELKLSMSEGRVTLIAQDVPLRQILAEWARIGQTKIVNGDRLTGPPLTLQLIDRPEREVLNVILRSAAGYIAAPRAIDAPGLARFDRIMILASSQAPAYSPSAAPPPTFARPNMPPMPMPMPTPDDDPVEPNLMPPGMVPAQPNNPRQMNMPPGVVLQPGQQQPALTAPRPGMLPPPATPVNPYGPNQPIVRPGGPGGRGGGPGGEEVGDRR